MSIDAALPTHYPRFLFSVSPTEGDPAAKGKKSPPGPEDQRMFLNSDRAGRQPKNQAFSISIDYIRSSRDTRRIRIGL